MRGCVKLQSFVDRNGDSHWYWIDELRDQRSRGCWDSEEDARSAMQDGIDWDSPLH